MVSLSGSATWLLAIHNHCDAGYSGLTLHEQLRERLAGNRWCQVSVCSFRKSEKLSTSASDGFVLLKYFTEHVFALVCD